MSNVNVEKMEMTEDLEMVEEEMPINIKYLSIVFKNRLVFQCICRPQSLNIFNFDETLIAKGLIVSW